VSYTTRVTFAFSDERPLESDVSEIARSWLVSQNLYAVEDVLSDFLHGWTEGQTDFQDLVSQDIEGLMASVSAQYSGIRFYVRGMGEEFGDVWLRQFEDGKTVFSLGPFEQGDE
jgi:hypothetical protein